MGDSKLEVFISWHLNEVKFDCYWIDPTSFKKKQGEFSRGSDFPFEEPEDLVIFDRWLINGNKVDDSFRINYCDIRTNLDECEKFFNNLTSYKINSYTQFMKHLKNDP